MVSIPLLYSRGPALGPDTGYPDRMFRDFPQSLQENYGISP
jgi:hypothetical protein